MAFCLFTSVFTYAQNLISNPGFETVENGDPADWINLSPNTQTIEIASDVVYAGSNSLKINTVEWSGEMLVQYVPITPGKKYNLSVWCNLQSYTGTAAARTFMGLAYSYSDAEGNNLLPNGTINPSISVSSGFINTSKIPGMTSPTNVWQQVTLTTDEIVPANAAYITILLNSGRITGYYDNVSVTEEGAATKQAQTITGLSDITKTVDDADFDLSATASSSLPVSYTGSNASVATISGSTVHIVGAGTTTITATQAGNDEYEAAEATITLTVSDLSGIQTISAGSNAKLPVRVENGRLIVGGVASGNRIDAYTALGSRLQSVVSAGNETVLPGLPKQQVLIVRSGNAAAKVIL